ncbi:MAG: right-handed parallel beta-helix repeat-containing protein [Sedimentisphaerales bacterium]|nr:right-handed parallel beta-helix repeat-containing protein [Sedimentisphaerales bacterium]
MKTGKNILCLLFCIFLSSPAFTSEISWIKGLEKPDAWTIDPCEPTQNDVISFSGPVGPLVNSCYGMAYLGGTPTISIDEINKVVELWFQGPAPTSCVLIWDPICGLTGEFGPLSAGDWTFKSTQSSIAFEVPFTVASSGKTYYVDYDAPGPIHSGKIWKWAFTNLQDALAVATAGDTVLVAQGTYKPDEGGSQITGDRMAAFSPAPGVTLIGSCAGFGYADPNKQNVDTYTAILSGDLDGDDLWGILNKDDNSYQVVRISGDAPGTVVINGFSITAGQADGPDTMNSGAGLDVDNADVRLVKTTISGNVSGFGGGISCRNAELSMWNCTIIGNHARIYGGGLYSYSSDVEMINCLMTGNSTSQAEITGGSAIHNLGGNLTIMDCTIADNTDGTTPADGKAITSYLWTIPADCNLVITNSILYNGGNEILTNHSGTVSVSYSDVQGGWTGTGNINKNPQFVNPGQRSIEGQWINGDYTLKNNSPCLDKGSNSLLPMDIADLDKDTNTSEKLPIDLGSNTRIQNSVVDMGAFERAGTVTPPNPTYEDGIWVDVPTVVPSWPITLQSDPQTVEICLNFQAALSLVVVPTSAAGGTWTAWFSPDPGTVGPGCENVTFIVRGENVDLSQLSPGLQQIAQLSVYVQPASP